MSSDHVYAYVDETGDRGAGVNSSPIFGMAAVLVTDTGASAAQGAVAQLRADFNVPSTRPMSWKDDVKNHDRRKRAVEILSTVNDCKVIYVFADKSRLAPGSYRDDPQRFYNYVAFKMYKSIIWAARNWKGPSAELWTRFGHVRHHDHLTTKAYIQREAAADPKIPHQMEQALTWISANKYAESQAADLFGGFLASAIWPRGPFAYTEPSYLAGAWPLVRNSDSCAIPLGIMPMPSYDVLTQQPWFPCGSCRHA